MSENYDLSKMEFKELSSYIDIYFELINFYEKKPRKRINAVKCDPNKTVSIL